MSFVCPQEVTTLLLAAFLMGDKVTALNWLGFAVCLCGISLHVGLKACHAKRRCLLLLHIQPAFRWMKNDFSVADSNIRASKALSHQALPLQVFLL